MAGTVTAPPLPHAVVTFDTRRGVREFGVRRDRRVIAPGAHVGDHQGFRLTAAGLAIGFMLSVGAGTALDGLLYGVTPADALTYACVLPSS